MSEKVRIHALAKEVGITNKELVELLGKEGVEVKSHLASVDPAVAASVRNRIAGDGAGTPEPATHPRRKAAGAPTAPETGSAADGDKPGTEQTGTQSAAATATTVAADIDKPDKPETAVASAPASPKSKEPAANVAAKPSDVQANEHKGPGRRDRHRGRRRSGKFGRRNGEKLNEGAAADRSAIKREDLVEIHLKPPVVVKTLAESLDIKPNALIHELLMMNVFASINQAVDTAVAEQIAARHGYNLVLEKREKHAAAEARQSTIIQPEDIVYDNPETESRPPVVAFLGHVDHGKTSLLDRIRDTNVTAGEAGGITQHIGASCIEWEGHQISFIDTPGHEAFTAMRARGADVTDVVVLVIAADDGFMPQTVEALNHARAAGVTVVIAINKIDLPSANPDQILMHMQENDLMPEEWGGQVGVCRVSAITGDGIDGLLERLVLEAEILELKANPDLPGSAVVLEAQMEPGMGPSVNVLIKNGTLHLGDVVISGRHYGKIKAIIDAQGKRLETAGPSIPVKIVGLSGTPEPGAPLVCCEDERTAKKLSEERKLAVRERELYVPRESSIEHLFEQFEKENRNDLKLIIKTDVRGTIESVTESLQKLKSDKITTDLIHTGVGAITDNDVLLASASKALVVGFHVGVNPGVNALAKKEAVAVKLYSVIYELVDDIRRAMEGMLEPTYREEPLGNAEILQVFKLPRTGGRVCGCSVSKGIVKVGAHVRVHRGGELIYNGSIDSLRRFQDDAREVRQGFECGIRLDNFNDLEVGDNIEAYEFTPVPATL